MKVRNPGEAWLAGFGRGSFMRLELSEEAGESKLAIVAVGGSFQCLTIWVTSYRCSWAWLSLE